MKRYYYYMDDKCMTKMLPQDRYPGCGSSLSFIVENCVQYTCTLHANRDGLYVSREGPARRRV